MLAALINASALLRIAPSVFGEGWSSDTRDASIALGGTLAEVAMLMFVTYLLRLMWRDRRARHALGRPYAPVLDPGADDHRGR